MKIKGENKLNRNTDYFRNIFSLISKNVDIWVIFILLFLIGKNGQNFRKILELSMGVCKVGVKPALPAVNETTNRICPNHLFCIYLASKIQYLSKRYN